MAFQSDAQRRAAFANMPYSRKKKRSWKIKTGCRSNKPASKEPTVKIVSQDEFDKHIIATGHTISPFEKGLYVYKENTMYVNQDNIAGPEDLQRTLYHEKGHSIYGPDEQKAEAYAVDKILTEYKPQDPAAHERLMNAEMRLFHPTVCILHDPQTIPTQEKEKLLLKDAEMILSPAGSLLKGENPNNFRGPVILRGPQGENMDKPTYRFDITGNVTDVGLRLDLLKARKKDVEIECFQEKNSVEVYVRGDKEKVEEYYNKVRYTPLGEADGADFSELRSIRNPEDAAINEDRFMHALQCEQMGKFVGVGQTLIKETKVMQQDIRGIRTDIQGMSGKLDTLPERIAKAMKGS